MTDWNRDHIEALLERLILAAETIAARLPLPGNHATDNRIPVTPGAGGVIDADGWIDWHGGECPVPADTPVHVQLRADGNQRQDNVRVLAKNLRWGHHGTGGDIVAYRIAPGP